MAESVPNKSKGFSIDWLVKGSLTKIGDILDRLTGRGWKPSSSLATSELIERMKSLMDAEIRENGDKRKYAPHQIKLKMQWDKFSTDAEGALQKLENEFLIAAVDHINDKHYFTHAPLSVQIKPDYFTSGVKLYVGFEKMEAEDREAELDVTLEGLKTEDLIPESISEKRVGRLKVSFDIRGKHFDRDIKLEEGKRLSVGRTKENDLAIDDASVSKTHASLLLNKDGKLVVADIGSTNGTFVRGERIAYGKAIEIKPGDALMFGLINVNLVLEISEAATGDPSTVDTASYKVGEFEFTSRTGSGGETKVNEPGTQLGIVSGVERATAKVTGDAVSSPATEPEKEIRKLPPTIEAKNLSEEFAQQPAPTKASVDLNEKKQDWEI
jgi:pSer/pThr/pTyr-binding forkhead associated (FHA) protein